MAAGNYQLEKNVPEDVNQSYSDNFGVNFSRKFLDVAESYRVTPWTSDSSYTVELHRLKQYLEPKLSKFMEDHDSMKLHLTMLAQFEKRNSDPPG